MTHNYYLKYKNIELRPLEEEHIENLRIWRNDKEQTKYLRQIGYITPEMQKSWFENYKTDKNIITFAIYETEELNRMVGTVSLYDFMDDQVEIGKIQIGDKLAQGKGIGRIAFVMLMKLAFDKFGVKKVVATVNVDNVPARKSYFRIGFKIAGQTTIGTAVEDEIEVDKQTVVLNNNFYNEIQIIAENQRLKKKLNQVIFVV